MSQFSTQTGMQTPGQLDVFFTQSMARSVAAVGSTAGLAPLEWRARTLQREIVLQGSPPHGTDRAAELCERWATALGLDEFGYDGLEGIITWSRYESPWLIEVSSESR